MSGAYASASRYGITLAYERDWGVLDGLSERNIQQVRDRLAGDLHVDRHDLLTKLDEAASSASLIAIAGPSGSGKTAAVKAWAESRAGYCVIWLQAEELSTITPSGGVLQHPLLATLSAARKHAWVVVDGLDRSFSNNADAAVAELITAIEHDPALPFALIVTSQQQEWGRIAQRLAARNAIGSWRLVAAESFSDAEIAVVLDAHPKLRDVAYRGRFSGVLRSPEGARHDPASNARREPQPGGAAARPGIAVRAVVLRPASVRDRPGGRVAARL